MKIILATNNKNKILEITEKFKNLKGIEFVPLSSLDNTPEIIEDGNTFEENALKKALIISKYSGLPSLSDDSGLVIDALQGRPGVLSARYGGAGLSDAGKNILILKEMEGKKNRKARFIAVIAIAFPDGTSRVAEGVCEGEISQEARGDMGFGYDPIFYLAQYKKTMAELTRDEKNRISHRGLALEKALKIIREML